MLPDKVGWLLKLMGIGVPVIVILQQVMFSYASSFDGFEDSGLQSFRYFSLLIGAVMVGGYFVGKGLEDRKEWARQTLVWVCLLGPIPGVVSNLGLFLLPPPFVFFVILIFLINLSIPLFLAWKFNTPIIKKQFAKKRSPVEQENVRREIADIKQAQKHYALGNKLAKKSGFSAAIREYSQAISIAPDYGPALRNRGYAYQSIGDDSAAKDDYQAALDTGLRTKWMVKKLHQ